MQKISGFGLAAMALLLLAPSLPARADTVPGWYFGPGVVGSFQEDSSGSVAGTNNTAAFDMGWGVVAAVGYAWRNGIRVEGEGTMMRTNVAKVNGVSQNSGRISNFDILANVLYDFQTGTRWTPYIGVGGGVANVDADHIGTLTDGGSLNDASSQWAYQAIAGTAYEIADHWSITADYRYIGSTDPKFKTTAGNTASVDNTSHNVVIGVRFTMHAPEPPAPPLEEVSAAPMPKPAPVRGPSVPAPVPQSYMVFFDFDRSELTPEAQRIIAAAAEDFQRNGYARLVVTGHTDTMGTPGYNKGLSERRAGVVKDALVKLGVDPGAIASAGVGEKGLLVPTADGVREAQNRRSEIVLSKAQ